MSGERQEKGKSKKAFTLAEMLIVVAIIGVLVAISVPIFSSKLEDARERTDIANLRAAKARSITQYLENNELEGDYYYDAEQGSIVLANEDGTPPDSIIPYGKGRAKIGNTENFLDGDFMRYDPSEDVKDMIIRVRITDPQIDQYGVEVRAQFGTFEED